MKVFLSFKLGLVIVLTAWSNPLIGQTTVSGTLNANPPDYQDTLIDYTLHNVLYEFAFAHQPNSKESVGHTYTKLQVGQHFAKFADYFRFRLDSLYKAWNDQDRRVRVQELNQQLAIYQQIGFKKKIIKNLKTGQNIFRGYIPPNNYEFKVANPTLDWKLEKEHKSILQYDTQKATVKFAGRKWVAWFAPAIPIPLGPYVFSGLPGLIMELYDTRHNFHFMIRGINNHRTPIFKRIEVDTYVPVSKEKFYKLDRLYHKKPGLFYESDKSNGINQFPPKPYNPMELIPKRHTN